MANTLDNILLKKLSKNTACFQRNLLQEDLATALESITVEHRNLMRALKHSGVERNETMIRHLTEFKSQILLVISEIQERINETSRHLSTLENKKKFLRSYGAVTMPDAGFRP